VVNKGHNICTFLLVSRKYANEKKRYSHRSPAGGIIIAVCQARARWGDCSSNTNTNTTVELYVRVMLPPRSPVNTVHPINKKNIKQKNTANKIIILYPSNKNNSQEATLPPPSTTQPCHHRRGESPKTVLYVPDHPFRVH
jgi:hypothetical protein